MELNPDVDLTINVFDLTTEFREFPIIMYRYMQMRAKMDARRDIAKSKLKEIRALVYKRIKSDNSVKHTAQSMDAEIDVDPEVLEANLKFIQAEHDASTWGGAVDSMRAKKDCLIQLGSDRRKEL
jgi:hypothetical protein